MFVVKIVYYDEKTVSLFSDVRSVHVVEKEGRKCLHMYVLDPVKTASCPGFSEHEFNIEAGDEVYIMNENGKTVEAITN